MDPGPLVWMALAFHKEWVAQSFFTDCREFAMAGDYYCFVWQRQDSVVEGVQDFFHRATWQVGAADGAGEEGVAGDQLLFSLEVEADAAFGVAGGVQDAGSDGAGGDGFSGGDAAVDFDLSWGGYADPGGLHVEHFQKSVVVLVEQDGGAGRGSEFHGSADVVDVGVGDDDLFDLEIVFADQGQDVIDVVAGVDDHGFVGGLVADDRAVALQRADGEDFVDHAFIVVRDCRCVRCV